MRTPTQSYRFISNATRVLYYRLNCRFEFLLMSRSPNNFFNILFNVRNALSPVNDSITFSGGGTQRDLFLPIVYQFSW